MLQMKSRISYDLHGTRLFSLLMAKLEIYTWIVLGFRLRNRTRLILLPTRTKKVLYSYPFI